MDKVQEVPGVSDPQREVLDGESVSRDEPRPADVVCHVHIRVRPTLAQWWRHVELCQALVDACDEAIAQKGLLVQVSSSVRNDQTGMAAYTFAITRARPRSVEGY